MIWLQMVAQGDLAQEFRVPEAGKLYDYFMMFTQTKRQPPFPMVTPSAAKIAVALPADGQAVWTSMASASSTSGFGSGLPRSRVSVSCRREGVGGGDSWQFSAVGQLAGRKGSERQHDRAVRHPGRARLRPLGAHFKTVPGVFCGTSILATWFKANRPAALGAKASAGGSFPGARPLLTPRIGTATACCRAARCERRGKIGRSFESLFPCPLEMFHRSQVLRMLLARQPDEQVLRSFLPIGRISWKQGLDR